MTEDVYSNVFVMWICAARAARHWTTRSSRAQWGCLLMLAVRRTSRDDGFTPTPAVNSSIASSLQRYPAMETIALPVRLFVHFGIVERLGNPPPEEYLMIKTRMEKLHVSFGWADPWNVILSSFSARTLLFRRQEVHPACKKLGVGMLVATIWLELCSSSIQLWLPPPSSLLQ